MSFAKYFGADATPTPTSGSGYDDEFIPPRGMYKVVVHDTDSWVRESDGNEFAKLILEILEGEHRGKQFIQLFNFNNDVGASIAEQDLAMLGISLPGTTFNQLTTLLPRLVGTRADVSTKPTSRGERTFANARVQRVYTGATDIPAPVPAPAAANTNDDDDLPF